MGIRPPDHPESSPKVKTRQRCSNTHYIFIMTERGFADGGGLFPQLKPADSTSRYRSERYYVPE